MKKYALMISTCLSLSACTLGPDFMRPFTGLTQQENFINAAENGTETPGTMNHWWTRIEDKPLNTYVQTLLSDNLALKQASERIIQTREATKINRGGYYPSLGLSGDGGRSFTPGSVSAGTDRQYTTSYTAELTTSWQIDLFGRIQKSVESAKATYEASLYDKEALTQTLIAELLTRRIAIATNKQLLSLARQNVQNRQRFYDLIKRRYDLGASGVSLSDVYLAQDNVSRVQADVHTYERNLNEQTYYLDVLLGKMPGSTNPYASEFPILPQPIDIPICLPADLLDRRPDLRAAELRYKASNADIGVAIADLYPDLTLSGALGFTNTTTNDLFTAKNLAGSLLGSITNKIFGGGALRANIRLEESQARELSALYAEEILNAMREVETNLQAENKLAKELQMIEKSASALHKAEELSENRYYKGIETLQNLLDTQQSRYTTDQTYFLTAQERWNARINLYLALGGDWLGERPEQNACTVKGQKK